MKTEATASPTPASLSLQSLIDTRYSIIKSRSDAQAYGNDYPGQRTGIKRGQGMEFVDLRQYTPGDDVRHIDWNVTARSNEPHTRLYKQEKEQTTTVLVDLRPVMFNGSHCLRSNAAARYAAATLWQAEHTGDRCAAIVLDAKGVSACRPVSGSKGVLQSLELIVSAYKQSTATANRSGVPEPQLSDALELISANKRSGGCYIVFSGFDTSEDHNCENLLLSAAARGRTYAVLLLDELELSAPPVGFYRYQSNKTSATGRTPGNISLNQQTRYELDSLLKQQTAGRHEFLLNTGIEAITLPTSTKPTDFLFSIQQNRWI